MSEDLYKTLNVARDASKDDIKKAHRRLAMKFHPDKNPDDEKAKAQFKLAQEAYDVLSDDEKRAAYDKYGADFEKIRGGGFYPGSGGSGGGGAGFEGLDLEQIFGNRGGGGGAGFKFDGFGDFFEQLSGRGGGPQTRSRRGAPRPPQVGETVRHELELPLPTALAGGEVEFYLNDEKLSVRLPAGVETGSKVRLRGKGAASPNGGPDGDLILVIKVSEHPHFRRVGANLELTAPITIGEALLGGKIDVPTPAGTVTLTVPPGCSSGRRLRLKGQGANGQNGKGDLVVTLQIEVPKTIDAESKTLIEQFEQRNPMPLRANLEL